MSIGTECIGGLFDNGTYEVGPRCVITGAWSELHYRNYMYIQVQDHTKQMICAYSR